MMRRVLLAALLATACRPTKQHTPADGAAPDAVTAEHDAHDATGAKPASGSAARPNAGGDGSPAAKAGDTPVTTPGGDIVLDTGTDVAPLATEAAAATDPAPTTGPDTIADGSDTTRAPATTHAVIVTTPPTTVPPGPKVITKVVTTSGFDNSLRVKNLTQLRAALDVCVGKDMTTVSETMLLPLDGTVPAADGAGRFPFLTASKYPPGVDILSAEGVFLLDPARGERFGADADALSAPYLRSLEAVANVVAHNCVINAPGCACATKAQAHKLVLRCLPAFAPSDAAFKAAESALAATCAGGEPGMRQAIASLIASYAFASKN